MRKKKPSRKSPNRKKDVLGNRTNPNDGNLLCLGANNRRVFRGLSQLGTPPGPVSRSNYTNTHDQTKALVALCVPKRFCQSWESAFDDCRDADRALDALRFTGCSLLPSGKFGITPLCWLEHAFRTSIGPNHVKATELCMGESPTQTSSLFDIGEWHDLDFKSRAACEDVYLLDVVLNRQLRPPRFGVTGDGSSTVRKVQAFSKFAMSDKADAAFRSLIIILPNAGIFYCVRERRKAEDGVALSYVPMCIDWLRLKGLTLQPALGGYAKRILRVTRIQLDVTGSVSKGPGFQQIIKVGVGQHVQDAMGPLLPPDLYHDQDVTGMDVEELRVKYRKVATNSPSFKRGCRHYVSGGHHSRDTRTAFVIDPIQFSRDGIVGWDLIVSVDNETDKKPGTATTTRPSRNSTTTIQVRYLPLAACGQPGGHVDCLLRDITANGEAARIAKAQSVRAGVGEDGKMYAFGTRLHGNKLLPYAANKICGDTLPSCVSAARKLGDAAFPETVRFIQDSEVGVALPSQKCMRDETNMETSLGLFGCVSQDCLNASHYDPGDFTKSFCIWTETCANEHGDATYMVFPNIEMVGHSRSVKHAGLAIRLFNGVAVSWDGRILKHCTSKAERDSGSVMYGTFFSGKKSLVSFGTRVANNGMRADDDGNFTLCQ
jgi:hypothetical protein